MEIKINKEIRNYTESMFFGLSHRQFFFAIIGVGFSVLMYFNGIVQEKYITIAIIIINSY